MVLRWRRVFCTSIPPEPDSTAIDHLQNNHILSHSVSSPTLRCRATATAPQSPAVALSPELRCETKSTPGSPFSFLKSGLSLRTRRCGLCLRSVKKGRGMATFTAECSHNFHYPCISDHVRTQGSLACPVCSSLWKEMPLLCVDDDLSRQHLLRQRFDVQQTREKLAARFIDKNESRSQPLKVYNDDEPLVSLTPKARFIPIPEYDESCDDDSVGEFEGFCVNGSNNSTPVNDHNRDIVEVRLLPEAAVIAASRRHETYAVVLKVKAPSAPEKTQRAPIDVVAVVDVSSKITSKNLHTTKKAMRSIISSLSPSDRLSIVAFSSHSKRLQPLRRMTTGGKRAARCIIDAMAVLQGSSNAKDAVKKAVKVLLDRQEKNPVATIIVLTDHSNHKSSISSLRYPHSRIDIRIHSLKITEDHLLAKCIRNLLNLLNVVVQDLRLQLELVSASTPAVIAAVYSPAPEPTVVGSSSVEIGELSAGEERELLVELKTPSSAVRSHRVLSVRCCYRESSTQEIIYGAQQALLVPHPTTVGSSASYTIERLRMFFISTRALAQSRRLREGNDLTGAYNVLVSARGLMEPSGSACGNEFMLGLEAELSELQRRLKSQVQSEGQGEPLTPTSAWRMADKLAKVAMMRKSVNRVGDLHGFEDARF